MTEFDVLLASIPSDIAQEIEDEVSDCLDFAILVRDWLEIKGWTQKELAQKLGMKPSQLSLILSGNTNLTLKTIRRFERVFGERFLSFEPSPLTKVHQQPLKTTPSLSKCFVNEEGCLIDNKSTIALPPVQQFVHFSFQGV
jgi:transcriptional regulator with XRE-family HTH domain